jgi:DNA-binding transcriptional LysR family regulator
MPPESAAWSTFRHAFANAGIEFKPSFQIRNTFTTLAMVRAGIGVGFATRLMAASIGGAGIKLLPVNDTLLSREVGIVTVKGRSTLPGSRALIEILRQFKK